MADDCARLGGSSIRLLPVGASMPPRRSIRTPIFPLRGYLLKLQRLHPALASAFIRHDHAGYMRRSWLAVFAANADSVSRLAAHWLATYFGVSDAVPCDAEKMMHGGGGHPSAARYDHVIYMTG
jgi:hypothetical protein